MKKHLTTALCAIALLASCHRSQTADVHFSRLEQVLFGTPADRLRSTLEAHKDEYSTPLLNIAPHNPEAMQMLAEFVADPGMRHIYRTCDSLYHDLGWLERDLGKALGRAQRLMPSLQYKHFYTLVTGDFDDYSRRVFCDRHDLAISLDHYAVGQLGGVAPAYIERLSRPEYMAADCMAAIAMTHIARPDGDPTLLDIAIAEGKQLYFVEQAMPGLPDTILLRYSPSQLDWAKRHTPQVWGTLIYDKLLYSNDYGRFHNLIDEAPKTNAFGEGSAPRMPAYIGLLIVRRYVQKTGCSMQELFDLADSQRILSVSGWRP